MILVSFGWLVIKLLCIAAVFVGVRWLINYLGVAVPEKLMQIFAAICVILGIIFVIAWLFSIYPSSHLL